MTVAELLGAFAQLGVDVYLDTADVVRVRAAKRLPESVREPLEQAVLVKLRHAGRDEVRAYLVQERAEALERITAWRAEHKRQEPAT